MSFHGGLIGVILVMLRFARKKQLSLFTVSDFIAPLIPLGLGAGRLGNFINGELWGRPTDVPWAMVFPSGGEVARHPSQLYEAGLEGIVLGLLLWFLFWKTDARYQPGKLRSEEHTSELQSLMRISYAVFCLKKKNNHKQKTNIRYRLR